MANHSDNASLFTDNKGQVFQRFASSTCILICGTTATGKSHLINSWLENLHSVFQEPVQEVVYIFEENTADLEQQRRLAGKINITFREGFPADSKLLTNGGLFQTPLSAKAHRLLVLDDVFGVAIADKNMARFASTYAHHHKVIHIRQCPPTVLDPSPTLVHCLYDIADKHANYGSGRIRPICAH
jgi:hypothetical protein